MHQENPESVFVDLETTCDRVPRKIMWWALQQSVYTWMDSACDTVNVLKC